MRVSVLMPVKGRPEQTAALIPRLLATAGAVSWELIAIVDEDPAVLEAIQPFRGQIGIIDLPTRQGYWNALAHGAAVARGQLLSNIANDVLPGLRWLERAVAVYDRMGWPDGGVVGYNDGLLFDGHTGHLLAGRDLLQRWYGSGCWPTAYDHLYGDTEICQRAMADGRYAIALKAVLFHNHPVVGRHGDDVYAASHRREQQDAERFAQRRALGWPQ